MKELRLVNREKLIKILEADSFATAYGLQAIIKMFEENSETWTISKEGE